MKLDFKGEYKSIDRLPIEHLPALTLLTGLNGTGKTHLLKAIKEGALVIEGIPTQRMRYYDWNNMVPSSDTGVVPRSQSIAHHAETYAVLSKVLLHNLLWPLKQKYDIGEFAITKDHLLQSVDNGPLYAALPRDIQADLATEFRKHHDFWTQKITDGIIQNDFSVDSNPIVSYQRKSPIVLNGEQCISFLHIVKKSGKTLFDLSETDCTNCHPLVTRPIDPFNGALTQLFAAYVREKERNDLNEIRFRRGDAESFLTDEEFLNNYGLPPWEIMNQVLAEANMTFRFAIPSPDAHRSLELQLKHTVSGADVGFSSLSSGERVLIALAQFLYLAQDPRQPTDMPDLFLLDEIDAPLHPSMTVAMLRIIDNVMVQEYGLQVIMTTHSPSTIALAPEESIHIMSSDPIQLRKATRDEAIRVLTVGVPILSINRANRRQVFVESQHDVGFFESIAALAQPYLLPDVSLSFIASGHDKDGGCARVKKLVNSLAEAGNRSVFGIVDWDGHHVSTNQVHVLGENARHSIENFLFDPTLLAALLVREKLIDRGILGLQADQTYVDMRGLADEQLQLIVNTVLKHLDLPSAKEEVCVPSCYINGRTVQVPISYFHVRGHDLEQRIKCKFPQLNKFKSPPELKREILAKVLDDLPGFLPMDLVELLRGIQDN